MNINSLVFPSRAREVLEMAGIETVGDLHRRLEESGLNNYADVCEALGMPLGDAKAVDRAIQLKAEVVDA